MDRIEMLIVALIGVQSDITSDLHAGFSWENLKEYRVRRTAIRTQIADEYRAMVEALEKYEMAEQYADEHGVAAVTTIELLTEAYEAGHTVLARVKGE